MSAYQISRGVTSGTPTYPTGDASQYPISEPVEKIEAKIQCTGEARYVDDTPMIPGELFAAVVMTKVARCDLDTVNPSPALVRLLY
jgi:xanthine dehydrogenase/oxidase